MALHIACVLGESRHWTGPATYQRAMTRALSGRHELIPVRKPGDERADLYHVLDVKRVEHKPWARRSRPLVIDIHDHYWCRFTAFPCPDLPLRWLLQKVRAPHYRRWIAIADAVICHSQAVAQYIDHPAVHIVPYGLDPACYAGQGEKSREPLLLLAGRDWFRKGLPVALQAVRVLREQIPGLRLMVVGDEFWHTRAAALLLARGLPVKFLPGMPPERLLKFYHQASVLILPSYIEAFGIVLLEALAAGLPVVASRVGGIPEAVADRVSGLLFTPGRAEELAERVCEILMDDDLRESLIQAGQESIRGRFDLETMRARLEEVYSSVL